MLNNKRQGVWISRIIFVLLMIMLISGCKSITPKNLTSSSSIEQTVITTTVQEPLTTILTTTTISPKYTTTIPFITTLAREYVCSIYKNDEELDIYYVSTSNTNLLIMANVHLSRKEDATQKALELIQILSDYLVQYNKGILLELVYYDGTIGVSILNYEVKNIATDVNYLGKWETKYFMNHYTFRFNSTIRDLLVENKGCHDYG